MTPGLSVYLDVFRLCLALIVVVSHAQEKQLGGSWFAFDFGAEAVTGFFVLSGFVIAHVATMKERDPIAFGAGRLSRLWSILLPALALTPVIDMIGGWFSFAPYQGWGSYMEFNHPGLRLAAAALFLNQLWFFSIAPLSNMPVWSLGYEAWYYVIFGACVFARGWRRVGLVGLMATIAGPAILLLMPAWLAGAWLYRRRKAIAVTRPLAFGLFVGAPLMILAARAAHLQPLTVALTDRLLGENFMTSLTFADSFLWQTIVGALICAHLVGAISLTAKMAEWSDGVRRLVRSAGTATYAIYLFHFPLQLAAAAMLQRRPDGPAKTAIVVIASLVLSTALGALFAPFHGWLKSAFLLAARRAGNARQARRA